MCDRPRTNLSAVLLMLACLVPLAGCNSDGEGVRHVEAEYLDLNDKSVAVMVYTPDDIGFNFPLARPLITKEICRRIMAKVPDVRVVDPEQVLAWQEKDENRYWAARPKSELLRQFGVDRLVVVEMDEYRTRNPGNRYELRGVISATVVVIEAESSNPDNYSARFNKLVMYPQKNKKLDAFAINEKKVERQTQVWFCEEVAGLFYDHTLQR